MTKRINKILWNGTEVPQAATRADGLDGLNLGELFIKNDPQEPGIYTRTTDGKVVLLGGGGSGTSELVDWNSIVNKPTKVSYFINDAGYATTSDLDTRIDALVNGAPQAYDTLKEIADVLAGNVDSIADILDALGTKVSKTDFNTAIANVNSSISALNTELSGKIDLKLDAVTFNELFEKVQLEDGTWAIKAKLGLFSDGFISAKGSNVGGTSSEGGAVALYQLNDVLANGTSVNGAVDGAVFVYDGKLGKWKGVAQSEIVPNLTGYAKESWVLQQGFLTEHQDLSGYAKLSDIPVIPTTDINKGVTAYGWGDHSKVGYLTGITSALVTGALGYTPYNAANFTKANIKSTLGISDWALASSKPSYTTKEVTEDTNLYFTNARAVAALKSITDGLQSDIDTKLDASVFSELFEKVTLEGGVTAIRAKYGLFTDYFLSAKGANSSGGSSSGEGLITSLYRYADLGKTFADTNNDTFNAYTINKINTDLGSRISVLEGKATNVSFTQSLTSGTQIGTITIDGASKNIYAPTIPTKLSQFTDDVVSGKYLSLSGGIIRNSVGVPLVINNSTVGGASCINFRVANVDKAQIGYENALQGTILYNYNSGKFIGVKDDGTPVYSGNTLWHSGNFTPSDYFPLSGGTISGTTTRPLTIKTSISDIETHFIADNNVRIYLGWNIKDGVFLQEGSSLKYIGIKTDGTPYYYNGARNTIIHSGNIGSQSVASADKLTTARTIWGQSFDGTGNVDGDIKINALNVLSLATTELQIGAGTLSDTATAIYGTEVRLYSGASNFYPLILNSSGNVGIGTTSPKYKLDVVGDVRFSSATGQNSYLYLNRNGSDGGILFQDKGVNKWQVVNTNNGLDFYDYTRGVSALTIGIDGVLNYVGTIHSTTGIWSDGYVSAKGQNTSSDMRLKNVLNEVVLGVKDIANAPSMRFAWKNGGGVDVGSSAQYWQKLLPDAVKERDGMLEMQYANIALLSAIALAKNFETHEERIARLEKENKELRNEINSLRYGA